MEHLDAMRWTVESWGYLLSLERAFCMIWLALSLPAPEIDRHTTGESNMANDPKPAKSSPPPKPTTGVVVVNIKESVGGGKNTPPPPPPPDKG